MTVSDLGFTLDRTYAAPPERVYAYFTDPELMARWFCPNPDLATTCRPRRAARRHLAGRDGRLGRGRQYVEVEPPTRLVFTFDWEHDDEAATTVTVQSRPTATGPGWCSRTRSTDTDGGHEEGWAARSPGWTGCSA